VHHTVRVDDGADRYCTLQARRAHEQRVVRVFGTVTDALPNGAELGRKRSLESLKAFGPLRGNHPLRRRRALARIAAIFTRSVGGVDGQVSALATESPCDRLAAAVVAEVGITVRRLEGLFAQW